MGNYIKEIRDLVGSRPIFLPGSALLVISKDREILLQLRKDTSQWGLPGGVMELGESFEQTAKRELLEEAGITATKLRQLKVFSGESFFFQYPNGHKVYNIIALFLVEEWEGEPSVCDDESKDIRFHSLTRLPELSRISAVLIERFPEFM